MALCRTYYLFKYNILKYLASKPDTKPNTIVHTTFNFYAGSGSGDLNSKVQRIYDLFGINDIDDIIKATILHYILHLSFSSSFFY